MQLLLTRGIPGWHSEWKDIKIGPRIITIPKDWGFVTIEEITIRVADIDHKMPKDVKYGAPFISSKDILDNAKINFTNIKQISEKDYQNLSKKIHPVINDIIYARIGSRLGKAAMVLKTYPKKFQVSYSCFFIRPNIEMISPKFLLYNMNSSFIKYQANLGKQSIGVPDLGLAKISKFKIPLPNLQEQEKLSKIIAGINLALTKSNSNLEEYERIKKGLMQQLLTGKIRVDLNNFP